ncbi:chromosomal replication initiator protein DnaA [Minwuia thermotolerans]|uniref:Chromosomal replication initiator protein DnaA n=1 Tax=Minwuia thermotolerans TaxID=2056226 RepID=A0A2M9G5Y0_9PROT|nr:chromosomal replication initiator protein DnaA [Minwuia thermotolerans]
MDDSEALHLLWQRVGGRVRKAVGDAAFKSWLAPLRPVALHDDRAVLLASTAFLKDWVRNNYQQLLLREFQRDVPHIREIAIHVGLEAAGRGTAKEGVTAGEAGSDEAEAAAAPARAAEPAREDTAVEGLTGLLDAALTFDNFVVGKANELAYAAARRVADSDDVAFNPLFLYSGVGLGKTHLMQAIAWHIVRAKPGRRVMYLSAEKFMYQFIRAVRFKDTMAFKEQFRSVDVLMIDDLQFFTDKNSTQEEFFHTFNELVDRKHQVVISADRSPSDLDGMEERVRSRLGWGLVADIHPTDFELRVGILEQKLAMNADVHVPEDVLQFLAHRITSNVRELEGALKRVIAHHELMGREITLDLARDVLADLLRANSRKITIDEIQKKVAEHFSIKITEMSSSRRARAVARPRQVAMYLSKKLTTRSLPDIGRRFGNRDHTTVLHGVRKIEELIQSDSSLAEDVRLLEAALSN